MSPKRCFSLTVYCWEGKIWEKKGEKMNVEEKNNNDILELLDICKNGCINKINILKWMCK